MHLGLAATSKPCIEVMVRWEQATEDPLRPSSTSGRCHLPDHDLDQPQCEPKRAPPNVVPVHRRSRLRRVLSQFALPGGGLASMGQHPARTWKMACVTVRVLLQVILMFGLGLPEWTSRYDLGHNLAGP